MARPQKCAWAHQAPGNRRITSLLTCCRAEGPDSCCFSPALTADISCQLMEKEILNPRVSAIVRWSFWWPFRESSLWPGWPPGIRCAVIVTARVTSVGPCSAPACSLALLCYPTLCTGGAWGPPGQPQDLSWPRLLPHSAHMGGKRNFALLGSFGWFDNQINMT